VNGSSEEDNSGDRTLALRVEVVSAINAARADVFVRLHSRLRRCGYGSRKT
jgi:hypothetical protein